MTMLEVEAAAVGHSKDPARISELATELGLFAKESFAKLERAADRAEAAADLNPFSLEPLFASASIAARVSARYSVRKQSRPGRRTPRSGHGSA